MSRGLRLVLIALPTGCGVLEPDPAIMHVEPDHMKPWEYGDDWFVSRTGLHDPKGLAGVEVRIYWQDSDTLTFTASDLPTPDFEVPHDGFISVDARLRQRGEIVSEGTATWYLEHGAQWGVYVNRVPAPLYSSPERITGPNPIFCSAIFCHRLWRFDLRDDVRNHPLEAFWLLVYRSHPDDCADVVC